MVHLLPNVAYWQLRSPNLFVNLDGEVFDFLGRLSEPQVRAELLNYEIVVGIGLDSRTSKSEPEMSKRRARTLCKGIADSVSGSKSTSALGLSIGTYTGPEIESATRPDFSQRLVLIMGVATSKSELELNHIVSKVLREIRYSGVDLSLYTGLAPGGRIEWVAMTDCDRPVVNLATR